MLLTSFLTSSIHLHLTLSTPKVFLADLLFVIKSLSTVYHTTKVGFLAIVALVEGTVMHGELEQLAFIVVARASKALILIEPLIFGHF